MKKECYKFEYYKAQQDINDLLNRGWTIVAMTSSVTFDPVENDFSGWVWVVATKPYDGY